MNKLFPIAFGILVMISGGVMVKEYVDPPPPCGGLPKKQIAAIVEVHHRDATVQFKDGTLRTLNQPIVKPGDWICPK